jgi:hypothetical protein
MPIDSALMKTLLVGSCAPFERPQPEGCGAGVLDSYAALRALDAHIDRTFPDDPGQVEDE